MSLKAFNIQLNIMLGKHENKHVYIMVDVNVLHHCKGSLDTQNFKNILSSSFFHSFNYQAYKSIRSLCYMN